MNSAEPIKSFVIPADIEAALQRFDASVGKLSCSDIETTLHTIRNAIEQPTPEEHLGAYMELVAFALAAGRHSNNPWNSYFGPVASREDESGNVHYIPDISGITDEVISHWVQRAEAAHHPVLRARYADLAWEMVGVIGGRRDPANGSMAIDAYLAIVSGDLASNPNEAFEAAVRAYDLSIVLADGAKTESAKAAILNLHRAEIVKPNGLWWIAWDRLAAAKRKGATEEDLAILVDDLEALVTRHGDVTDPAVFNPHLTQAAANRLINHYTRKQLPDEAKRVHLKVAQVYESFAGLADPTIGSTVLQTAVNAYSKAGNRDEANRVRILMQEKVRQAVGQMKQISTEVEVPFDEMEKFLASIVAEDLGRTFFRLAASFLRRRTETEKFMADMTRAAPLTSMIRQEIVADDHVVGVIGSTEADPFGRIVKQASDLFRMNGMFLHFALERAIEVHSILPEHWVAFANRHGLYENVTLLLEGVHAWYARDFVKAVHVIVPQIEVGLRAIFGALGHPTTKPDRMIREISTVVNMGDILYNEAIETELGPDLTLHFKALFADPRGWNIRNRLSHGLLAPLDVDEQMAQAAIHGLLVLGAWREFAEHRR